MGDQADNNGQYPLSRKQNSCDGIGEQETMQQAFRPSGGGWKETGGMLPTPHRLNDSTIRVYVAFLDSDKIGRVGYVDLAADDPMQVTGVSEEPVLDTGEEGTFDEHGVNPSCVLEYNGRLLLYYVGWQRLQSIRYTLFSGLAESTDGGETFERVSEAPILDRTDGERYFRTAPYVFEDEGEYRIYYIGGNDWIDKDGSDKRTPVYDIRTMVTDDPTSWPSKGGEQVLEHKLPVTGYGGPFVRKRDGRYQAWYSVRHRTKDYTHVEYVEEENPSGWNRGEIAFGTSEMGWDSEMVCFPYLIDVGDKSYLFYNGNGFGDSGFGVSLIQ